MGRTFYGPGFGEAFGLEGFWFEVLGRAWIWDEEPPTGVVPLIPKEGEGEPIRFPKGALSPELVELLGPVAALRSFPPPEELERLLRDLQNLHGRLRNPTVERTPEERGWEARQRQGLRITIERLRKAEALLEERGWRYGGGDEPIRRQKDGTPGRPEQFLNRCVKVLHDSMESGGETYGEEVNAVMRVLEMFFDPRQIDRNNVKATVEYDRTT